MEHHVQVGYGFRVPHSTTYLSLSGDFLPKSQISTTTNKRPAQASLERGTRHFTGSTFTKRNRKSGCRVPHSRPSFGLEWEMWKRVSRLPGPPAWIAVRTIRH